jgi:hypothetical protein
MRVVHASIEIISNTVVCRAIVHTAPSRRMSCASRRAERSGPSQHRESRGQRQRAGFIIGRRSASPLGRRQGHATPVRYLRRGRALAVGVPADMNGTICAAQHGGRVVPRCAFLFPGPLLSSLHCLWAPNAAGPTHHHVDIPAAASRSRRVYWPFPASMTKPSRCSSRRRSTPAALTGKPSFNVCDLIRRQTRGPQRFHFADPLHDFLAHQDLVVGIKQEIEAFAHLLIRKRRKVSRCAHNEIHTSKVHRRFLHRLFDGGSYTLGSGAAGQAGPGRSLSRTHLTSVPSPKMRYGLRR